MIRTIHVLLALIAAFSITAAPPLAATQELDPPAVPLPEGLTQTKPIIADGDDDITITMRHIDTPDDGVTVTTNADVILENCYIVAGKNGIVIKANGDVYLRNSFVQGGETSIVVVGNGSIFVSRSTIQGCMKIGDNGDFYNEGENNIICDDENSPPM